MTRIAARVATSPARASGGHAFAEDVAAVSYRAKRSKFAVSRGLGKSSFKKAKSAKSNSRIKPVQDCERLAPGKRDLGRCGLRQEISAGKLWPVSGAARSAGSQCLQGGVVDGHWVWCNGPAAAT